jgi:hypothetical protein
MGDRRRRPEREGSAGTRPAPIPLDPVDLLAGIAPGFELDASDLPAGVAGATEDAEVVTNVDEIGRLVRSGEPIVRRLIRSPGIYPVDGDRPATRAPRPPRDPGKPGE